ncbi:hypothetical protein OQA88_8945 [Cercophora sp. LCS_1]
MKFSAILSLGAGLAAALPYSGLSKRTGVEALDLGYKFLADKPANAPEGYEVSVVFPNQKRSALPAALQRRQSPAKVSTSDFFECTNANPAPVSADCGVIVSNVLATGNDLIVAQGSCLVFSYRTCQAFFCSLCTTLTTSTDFIGTQLDTVDALCVSGGQAGTIVGEEAPQYEVGFVRSGATLPNYDVC